MSKFKKGDRVRCLTTHRRYGQRQGWTSQYASFLNGIEGTITGKRSGELGMEIQMPEESFYLDTYDMEHAELVNQSEQENKMKFDMKENGWFIRYNNEEEFNLVQEWLQENYGDNLDCHFVSRSEYVTNVASTGYIFDTLKHGSTENIASYAKEIKLNFKTVVDSVEWPEVETEAQKELAKLQKQIEELSAQAEKLKETIK